MNFNMPLRGCSHTVMFKFTVTTKSRTCPSRIRHHIHWDLVVGSNMHAVHLVTHGSLFHGSWYHFVNTGVLRKRENQHVCCYMHR